MSNYYKSYHPGKRFLNWVFVAGMAAIELILMWLLFHVIDTITAEDGNLFKSLALGMIILWIAILIAYLAWAVYFYNINLGLTNEDWSEIRESKRKGIGVKSREHNPHANETLGLPPGTVRGIMALSLLMGALAMMIAALGSNSTYSQNEFFVDNFEFFKTAFLMMIAFYFGDKSLKHLRKPGNANGIVDKTRINNQNSNNRIIHEQTIVGDNNDMETGDVDMDEINYGMIGDTSIDEGDQDNDQDDNDFEVKGSQG